MDQSDKVDFPKAIVPYGHSQYSDQSPSKILMVAQKLAEDSKIAATGKRKFRRKIGSLDLSTSKITDKFAHIFSSDTTLFERKREFTLTWLKENGYGDLAEKLRNKKGYPWDILFSFKTPILIEQLTVFISLDPPGELLSHAFNQVEAVASSGSLSKQNDQLASTRQVLHQLGLLIYAVDCNISLTPEQVELELRHQIAQVIEESSKTLLDKHAYFDTQAPIVMGKLAVTSIGEFNLGLLSRLTQIVKEMAPLKKRSLSILQYRCEYFLQHSELRSKLTNITPRAQPAVITIQRLLNLPETASITSQETKQAILATLLTHMRQTSSTTCFAASLCLSQLALSLPQVVDDLVALIGQGHLTRTINSETMNFPYLTSMFPIHMQTSLKTDSDLPLWERPEVKKVLSEASPKEIKNWLDSLQKKEPEAKVETLLGKLSSNKLSFEHHCSELESLFYNDLISIWRNAIAGMAEGKITGMLKSEILQTILFGIDADYEGLPKQHQHLGDLLSHAVIQNIASRIFLLYDPMATAVFESSQEVSPEGGFILFDTHHASNPEEWKRVQSEKDFRLFISNVVKSTHAELAKKTLSPDEEIWLQSISNSLLTFIQSDEFLDKILSFYFSQNPHIKKPSHHIESYLSTPWISKAGNDSEATLKVYHQGLNSLMKKRIKPHSAEKLLFQLGDIIKKAQHSIKENPHALLPCRVLNFHAFNIMPFHPSFIFPWLTTAQKEGSLKRIKEEGNKVSHMAVDQKTCVAIFKGLEKKAISESGKKSFRRAVKNIPSSLPFTELRSQLLEILYNPLIKKPGTNSQTLLDTTLFGELSKKATQNIRNNAIYFADSNWAKDGLDIFFCFIFNPGSQNFEVWKSTEDGSNFEALNQSSWLTKNPWDLFIVQAR